MEVTYLTLPKIRSKRVVNNKRSLTLWSAMTLYIRPVHILCRRRAREPMNRRKARPGWQTAKRFSRYVVNFCSIAAAPRARSGRRDRWPGEAPQCLRSLVLTTSSRNILLLGRFELKNGHALPSLFDKPITPITPRFFFLIIFVTRRRENKANFITLLLRNWKLEIRIR